MISSALRRLPKAGRAELMRPPSAPCSYRVVGHGPDAVEIRALTASKRWPTEAMVEQLVEGGGASDGSTGDANKAETELTHYVVFRGEMEAKQVELKGAASGGGTMVRAWLCAAVAPRTALFHERSLARHAFGKSTRLSQQ